MKNGSGVRLSIASTPYATQVTGAPA
jgi:hypothetical protein